MQRWLDVIYGDGFPSKLLLHVPPIFVGLIVTTVLRFKFNVSELRSLLCGSILVFILGITVATAKSKYRARRRYEQTAARIQAFRVEREDEWQ